MKVITPLLILSAFLTQQASGASITNLGALSQPEFRVFSEDLASALSYKAVSPATPLGITGFDMGVEATRTNLSRSSAYWAMVTDLGSPASSLTVPKLHLRKGLAPGMDVGLSYAKILASNISAVGAELQVAIPHGNPTIPTMAVRAAYTRMTGVSEMTLDSSNLEFSVSQGLAAFTPYLGVGRVWSRSAPVPGLNLLTERFAQNKVFIGANLNLTFANLAMEWDRTGNARSASLKFGYRF